MKRAAGRVSSCLWTDAGHSISFPSGSLPNRPDSYGGGARCTCTSRKAAGSRKNGIHLDSLGCGGSIAGNVDGTAASWRSTSVFGCDVSCCLRADYGIGAYWRGDEPLFGRGTRTRNLRGDTGALVGPGSHSGRGSSDHCFYGASAGTFGDG